tara:strand:- start:2187 stop:2471 length:285 start_codon:yes stop_codon:yes gene_type:complete
VEVKDILDFQVNRSITALYKQFLVMLEDLQEEHLRCVNKIKRESSVNLDEYNYLDQTKMDYLRKKTLDSGNNCKREIMTVIDHFSTLNANEKII